MEPQLQLAQRCKFGGRLSHRTLNMKQNHTLAHLLLLACTCIRLVITVQHFLLASKQPKDTRMDMVSRAKESYLRSHPRTTDLASPRLITPDIWNDLQGDIFPSFHDEFFHDEFFGPFLDQSPLMKEMMKPAFKMDEYGDQVSLVMSIPNIPLKDM